MKKWFLVLMLAMIFPGCSKFLKHDIVVINYYGVQGKDTREIKASTKEVDLTVTIKTEEREGKEK